MLTHKEYKEAYKRKDAMTEAIKQNLEGLCLEQKEVFLAALIQDIQEILDPLVLGE